MKRITCVIFCFILLIDCYSQVVYKTNLQYGFFETLELNNDSTYKIKLVCDERPWGFDTSTSSKGTWNIFGDTLILSDYLIPGHTEYDIIRLEGKDTVKETFIAEFIIQPSINKNNNSVKIESINKEDENISVHEVNFGECDRNTKLFLMNDSGRVIFKKNKYKKNIENLTLVIHFDYLKRRGMTHFFGFPSKVNNFKIIISPTKTDCLRKRKYLIKNRKLIAIIDLNDPYWFEHGIFKKQSR